MLPVVARRRTGALSGRRGPYVTYNRQATSIGARGFGLPGDFNSRLPVMIDGIRGRAEVSAAYQDLCDKRYAEPGAENNWQNSFEQDSRSIRIKFAQKF